jgi:thermitase
VIPGIGVQVVGVPPGAEEAAAGGYARNPHVAFAEPDYIAHAMQVPVVDDPDFLK